MEPLVEVIAKKQRITTRKLSSSHKKTLRHNVCSAVGFTVRWVVNYLFERVESRHVHTRDE